MKQENEIIQELKAMGSMLAEVPRNMPYLVPEGYFARVNAAVREQIKYETDPATTFGKQTPFVVPGDYFASFPSKVLHAVGAEYKSTIPPSRVPFAAPEGYFEQLPGQVLAAIKRDLNATPDKTKIIPIKRTGYWKPMRLAAAAILAIGMGLTFYQLATTSKEPVAQRLSQIPKEDVRSYVLQHIDEFETEDLLPSVQLAAVDKKSFSSGLSGEDIIQYLDETGWGTELY